MKLKGTKHGCSQMDYDKSKVNTIQSLYPGSPPSLHTFNSYNGSNEWLEDKVD